MSDEPQKRNPDGPRPDDAAAAERPVYRKPVLRRYDQIEQVRPYGPSEV